MADLLFEMDRELDDDTPEARRARRVRARLVVVGAVAAFAIAHGGAATVASRPSSPPTTTTAADGPPPARSQDDYRDVVTARAHELSACMAAPVEAPTVLLEILLDADGFVDGVNVGPPAVAATPVGPCLAEVVSDVRFPPPGRPMAFRVPLVPPAAL